MLHRLLNISRFLTSIRFFLTRQVFTKMMSLLIIGSMLANTTPASPQVIIASAGELGQDVRYVLLTNSTLASIAEFSFWDNPVVAFIIGKKKQQSITNIEISPNRAVIREGEEIALTAVALDGKGNPVQGAGFNWSAISQNKKGAQIPVKNGIFVSQYAGTFEVTAESGSIKKSARITVVKDSYNLALREATKQFEGQEQKNSAKRQLRNDVQKILTESRPMVFRNSTRMNKDEVRELNRVEGEFRRQNPNKKVIDQNKPKPQIRKAQPMQKSPNGQTAKASDKAENRKQRGNEEVRFVKTSNKGGPSAEDEESSEAETTENEPANNTSLYVMAQLDTITTSTITGCAYDTSYGYPDVQIYIDGDYFSGNYLGNANLMVNNSNCYPNSSGFSFDIPSWYLDGQTHTIYAYVYDADNMYHPDTWNQWMLLPNAPQTFQIGSGGGGGGGGTDANWNNNNYPTADDPGVQPGNPANNGTDGAGSSNFSFSAPVLGLSGRGMDVNLSLNYNSLLWHNDGTNISYDIDKGSPAPGWNIGFGKMMDMGSNGGAMIEDLDGTRHSYEGTAQTYGSYGTYHGRTTDGSFIDYKAYRGPGGLTGGTAYLANGTTISYGAVSNGVAYPTFIKDRHGNYMTIAYQNNQGPRITTITDNLGRVVTFNYDGLNRLVSITGPGQNGSTRTYIRLHYAQKTVTPSFSGLTSQIRDANPYQIDAIYYPDLNTGYWFGDNDSYSSYGMIAKVKEMRGMSWSGSGNNDQGTITAGTMSREMVYNYPLTGANLTTAPQYTTMTESWANMDTSAAVTTYSINNSASPRTTTITLPNGNKIKQSSYNNPNQWNDGLLYQIETLSPSNQVLSKSVTSWEQGDYGSARVTEIQSTDEKNQTTKQTLTYDSYYNQVATISEYGYSNNLLRKKVNTYENGANYRGYYTTINGQNVWSYGRHIFSLVKTEELLDTGNTRLSRNNYTYDGANLVNTPSVVMYDQTYNPHTTGTTDGPNCIQWDYTTGPYYDPYSNPDDIYWFCTAYEQIPNFDSSTLARGNVTQTTTFTDAAALSGAISYDSTYDITGNTRTATTDCCQQMLFSYSTNTQYSQPDSHTKGSPSDPNLQITESATYDFNTGLVKSSTNANGRTTTYTYDDALRQTGTHYSTGLVTQIWYHPGSNAYNELIWQGSSYTHVENHFNGRGQQILRSEYNKKTNNYWDQDNFTDTNITYDQMGRKATVSVPHQKNIATTGYTTYQYDLLSRVTQVTAPDGSTSKTFYNESSKPGSASSTVGNTVRSQDAWGRERWARTDDFGRLVEVVEPDPNGSGNIFDAGNMVTTYTYNPKDELTQVNQGDQIRAFKYDSLGRLTRQKLAEQNASLNDGGGFVGGNNGLWSDAFSYDNRSNLIQRTDARGVKTNFVYNNDPLNRLQQVNYDKTQADTTHTIHDASPVNLTYMSTGDKTRVWKADTWYVNEENSYDIEGRVSEYKVVYAQQTGQPFVTSYLYDTLSRLTEIRYPAQYGMSGNPRKVVTPEYDETSRLKELKVDNQIQMNEIVYNPLSQVTSLKTGAATGNADIEQYTYDAQTGLLTNQKVIKQNSSQTLLDLSYNYNRGNSKGSLNGKTGQLTHIVDNLNRNRDKVYEFDTLGRLIIAKGGGATGVGGVTANWTQNYTYDRYGNRTNVTSSGVTQDNQAVPTDGLGGQTMDNWSNRYYTSGYIYDLAGNLIRGQASDGSWQWHEYDTAGRLLNIYADNNGTKGNNIQGSGYGSSRQRVVSNEPTGVGLKWYVWGGSSVIAEYSATTWGGTYNWVKSYIYAGSRLLSTFTKDGSNEKLEFHHPDRLGTKLVTNNSANTYFEQSTLPFGTALNAESSGFSNQVFTSYDRSNVASLDYAVNRSYSSGQGRFTSVDPIGIRACDLASPQSLNLYSYVTNNPIDFIDPSGLLKVVCERWHKTYGEGGPHIPGSDFLRCWTVESDGVFGGGGTKGSRQEVLLPSGGAVAEGQDRDVAECVTDKIQDYQRATNIRNNAAREKAFNDSAVTGVLAATVAGAALGIAIGGGTPASIVGAIIGAVVGFIGAAVNIARIHSNLKIDLQANTDLLHIEVKKAFEECTKRKQSSVGQSSGGGAGGGGGGDYLGGSYRLYNWGSSDMDWLWWQYERERGGWGEPKILD